MAPADDPRAARFKKKVLPTKPQSAADKAAAVAAAAAADAAAKPAPKAGASGDAVELTKARAPIQLDPKGGQPAAPRAGAPAPLTSVDVGAKNATCIKG